jgi:hypothetical protein
MADDERLLRRAPLHVRRDLAEANHKHIESSRRVLEGSHPGSDPLSLGAADGDLDRWTYCPSSIDGVGWKDLIYLLASA